MVVIQVHKDGRGRWPDPGFRLRSVARGGAGGVRSCSECDRRRSLGALFRFLATGLQEARRALWHAGCRSFAQLAERAPCGTQEFVDPADRFATAHVGMLAYDMVHFVTKVPSWPAEQQGPIAGLLGDCTVVVVDHLKKTMTIASTEADDVAVAERHLRAATLPDLMPPPDVSALPSDITLSQNDDEYSAVVERCREYIRAGDAFQIVPSRTFSVPTKGVDPFYVIDTCGCLHQRRT